MVRGTRIELSRWPKAGMVLLTVIGLASCSSQQDREAKHLAKGKELFEKGKLAKAALEFRIAAQINPAGVEENRFLGLIAERSGDPISARTFLIKVIEQDPRDVTTLLKLGEIELSIAEDHGLSRANALLARDPNNADA